MSKRNFCDKFLLKFFISQNLISFILELTSKDKPGLTFALTSVTAAILKQDTAFTNHHLSHSKATKPRVLFT